MMNYIFFIPKKPVIFTIGNLSIHWYGLMYLISFFFSVFFLKRNISYSFNNNFNQEEIYYLLYRCFLGLFFGGRIGYVLLYNFHFFLRDPLYIFKIWQGGMSFHGGLVGVILVLLYISRSNKCSFLELSDFIVPIVPFGLGVGRLGNFINGELWGRVITHYVPWSMVFNNAKKEDLLVLMKNPNLYFMFHNYGGLLRHPSQLYEFFFEGILLFVILNVFVLKSRPIGSVSGLFLFFYGLFRIIVEFFREPDYQLGLFFNMFSMGQILSFPMVICGLFLLFFSYF